jgi:transposase-like protein
MSQRCKYTAEEKYEILKAYEDGIGSMGEIASTYKINRRTIIDWRYTYRKFGIDGLRESKTWKKYSKELKEQAVSDFLSGEYALRQIVRKYEISNKEVLRGWINKYNGHSKLTASGKGMSQSMTKGRATSWKERIEIVMYCIAHGYDYQNAAETYHVSYQQIYQWIKKYESGGEGSLKDRRGRKKDEEELSPEDRIQLAIKKLEAENERLRAENAFLKKLEELEGRRP